MINKGSVRSAAPAPRRRTARGGLAVLLSLLVHVALLAALGSLVFHAPPPPAPPPIEVALIRDAPSVDPEPPQSAPSSAPAAPAETAHAAPPPKPAPPQTPPLVLAADRGEPEDDGASAEVGEAALAGAGTADSGPSPHGCELARKIQNALRQDPLVQSEVAALRRPPGASGGAVKIWDGDWVRSPSEEGKGLAAVREAISWEVAFAPPACLTEPVHGLIVLKVKDGPGAPRLALGGGEWRWSDLRFARGARPSAN